MNTNEWHIEADKLYEVYKGFDEEQRKENPVYAWITKALRDRGFDVTRDQVRARYRVRGVSQKPPVSCDKADEVVQAQKERLIADNQKRIIGELSKRAAITEILVEKTCSAIAAIPPVPFVPQYVTYHGRDQRSAEEVILDISDIQAGTKIDKDGTGGLNEFNWGIMEREFDTLFRGVTSISKRQMELAPIRKLHIFMLGDMVEGWNIFPGQPQNIDQDVLNQTYKLEDALARFICQLLTVFQEIEVSCVVGNHGRVGKKGENPHWVSWDMVLYRNLEKSLSNYPQVTFNIPTAWYYIKEVNGWRFYLQHGDDVKGWGGIPFYGIDRDQKNSRELLETIDERFDYIEMGHLHTPAMLPLMGGGFVTINGCWPGGSILSMKNMKKTGKPIQWIKGIHPEYGVTWCYPIYLNGRR